jgi:hypothetical protein
MVDGIVCVQDESNVSGDITQSKGVSAPSVVRRPLFKRVAVAVPSFGLECVVVVQGMRLRMENQVCGCY